MKLLCAYLVVAIHTHPFEEVNETLSFISTCIIPRVAVPFFFVVSGYFYIQALQKGKKPFVKYVKNLLSTYILWSIIYFMLNFYDAIIAGTFNLKGYIVDCVIRFIWRGSYYHFWYFTALFICIVITTIFFKIKKMNLLYVVSLVLYVIGVMGCAYYQIVIRIPVVSKLVNYAGFENIRRVFMMGLPFFMMGYLMGIFNNKKKKMILSASVICLVLFLCENAVVFESGLQKSNVLTLFLYPFVFFIFLLCFEYPMNDYSKYSKLCRRISGFIYYVHPLIIYFLTKFGNIKPTILFVGTCSFSSILGMTVVKMNNKYLNKLL